MLSRITGMRKRIGKRFVHGAHFRQAVNGQDCHETLMGIAVLISIGMNFSSAVVAGEDDIKINIFIGRGISRQDTPYQEKNSNINKLRRLYSLSMNRTSCCWWI